ncbi:MAG: hypothetical protein ACP5NW_00765 [Candidatus Woesearchaeota archaeon]
MPVDPIQIEGSRLSEEYLKSVSTSQLRDRAYTPYELDKSERESLEEIKRGIKKGIYKTKDDIQDSLDFLEKLANKMNVAINNQKKENKTTWELESDLADLKKTFEQLNQMLQAIESKEVDDGLKKNKKRIIIRK